MSGKKKFRVCVPVVISVEQTVFADDEVDAVDLVDTSVVYKADSGTLAVRSGNTDARIDYLGSDNWDFDSPNISVEEIG